MLRVFVSLLPFTFTKSTDFDYVRSLKRCAEDLNVEFAYPQCKLWGWKENLFTILNKMFHVFHVKYRFQVHFNQKYLNSEYVSRNIDIVYSQEICPMNTNGKPVFLETTFMKPGDDGEANEFMEHSFNSRAVPLMRENLSSRCFINLKSKKEIENAIKIFPEAKDRFVNLPFLLPSLTPIAKEDIISKFTETDVLRFLFVGGQAKRKGLEELLKAYCVTRRKYPSVKMEMHIVSGFQDGNIRIPKDQTIVLHGKLSKKDTHDLFEKCHSFIMVSHRESYGLAYIEAMAKGCIVITRDYYPQKEMVDFGRIGLFATPYDVDSIVSAMSQVIEMNSEQRIKMALNGWNKFNTTYNYSVVVEKYKRTFCELVKRYAV